MHKSKKLGRWRFTYRNPYKRRFYFVISYGNQMKNTPVLGIWRFSIVRETRNA